jgi:2-polyprenyl-3-methyl-5-hydroxy-6-metoxy-1,4-benzoquinol methylase
MGDAAPTNDAHLEAKRPKYYRCRRLALADFLAANHPVGGRALDVGCGEGFFGAELLARGFSEVVGIEPVPDVAGRAQANLSRVIAGTFQGVDQDSLGLFDVVSFADSLEHMMDPWQALRDAREMLAPDGVLLLSVPNISHLSILLSAWRRGRWDYKSKGLLDRTHVRFFTPATLAEALVDAGFETAASKDMEVALSRKRRLLKPLIRHYWPHLLVFEMYVVAVPSERTVSPS